jgi:hypothetical protein
MNTDIIFERPMEMEEEPRNAGRDFMTGSYPWISLMILQKA